MPRYLWLVVIAALLFCSILVTRYYFEVNPRTYQQTERTDATLVDTSKPLATPNGRRPQDALDESPDKNDRTFGTVFPYFAAPQEE